MARGSGDFRFEDYEYELEREPEILDANGEVEDYGYECIKLFIDGNYDPGESHGRWGYYGATPGYGPDVEIFDIYVKGEDGELTKWDGELTKEEERYVCEKLAEMARAEIADYEMDAAVARAGWD